jgi:adenosylcobinamide-GDP ribazoletransferase
MTTNGAWLNGKWLNGTRLGERAGEIKAAILFLTRLPVGFGTPANGSDLARAVWAFPLVGILVGAIGAVVYALAHWLGLSAWPAATLSVAATLAATGALHEDGLADTADGFGGGKTQERKLEIMRDSRIGTYGTCALALSILLRVGALASLADTGPAVLALVAAHGAARATMPVFMFVVPPARRDGLSLAAGQPSSRNAILAGVLGILILAVCLGPALGIVALVLLLAAIASMAWLSVAQIDGQTGDVLGAIEQVGEIIVLLVASR